MKTLIEHTRHTCPVSKDEYFIDSCGNLVFIKSYKGDWGDWDEQTSCPCSSPADTGKSHTESETKKS